MKIGNFFKHFSLICRHKWLVFKFCCKLGQPWRGFWHDLSKFSPIEFFESIKYYSGTHSPITEAKKDKGYSEAWLHHKGRNKHHIQYWEDKSAPQPYPKIPYPYVVEMLCDKLSANIIYNGKNWTRNSQLEYYLKEREREKILVNKNLDNFFLEIFTKLSEEGLEKILDKDYIKQVYNKVYEQN